MSFIGRGGGGGSKADMGGKLISVTKQWPVWSKFSQWSAMKRHWKNMYGYRLDGEEDLEPLVFNNVSFWIGGSILTYLE